MDDKRLAEIREREAKATASPWVWRMPFGSRDGPELASPPNGMCIVMDAVRKGFNGATVRFAQRSDSMGGLMKPAEEFFAKPSGPRDTDYPTPANPDMEFMSHARTDIPDLLAEVDRLNGENARWKEILADETGETLKLMEALGVVEEVKGGKACMDAMMDAISRLRCEKALLRAECGALTKESACSRKAWDGYMLMWDRAVQEAEAPSLPLEWETAEKWVDEARAARTAAGITLEPNK